MISPMSNRSRFSLGRRETTLGRKHGRKWGDKEPQLTLGSPSPSLGKTCGCLMWQSYIPDAHVLEYIHEHFYCWEASYGKSKCPASFALWMPGLSCFPCEERSRGLPALLLGSKGSQGRDTKRKYSTCSFSSFKMGAGNWRRAEAKVSGKLFHLSMKTLVSSLSQTSLPAVCPTSNVGFLVSVE